MNSLKPHLLDDLDAQLARWASEAKSPSYRVGQVRKWLFEKRAGGFEEMSDLPKALRADLAERFGLWSAEVAKHTTAEDGTEKLLLLILVNPAVAFGECIQVHGVGSRSIRAEAHLVSRQAQLLTRRLDRLLCGPVRWRQALTEAFA